MPFLWLDDYLNVLISCLLNIKVELFLFLLPFPLIIIGIGRTDGRADGREMYCINIIAGGVPCLIAVVYISYHTMSSKVSRHIFQFLWYHTGQPNVKFKVIYSIILSFYLSFVRVSA